MKICVFMLFFIFSLVYCTDECDDKPFELKVKEDYCWTEEVEVVDRIVQTGKSVLNFAKKKLGISSEEETSEIQKCKYYMCILRQLHMLNANDHPSYESINEWTKRHVIYFRAIGLMNQLDKCNEALTNSTILERKFYADQIEQEASSDYYKSEPKEQTSCEVATEFIKCLSRQKECPVFQFP